MVMLLQRKLQRPWNGNHLPFHQLQLRVRQPKKVTGFHKMLQPMSHTQSLHQRMLPLPQHPTMRLLHLLRISFKGQKYQLSMPLLPRQLLGAWEKGMVWPLGLTGRRLSGGKESASSGRPSRLPDAAGISSGGWLRSRPMWRC